MRSFNLTLLSLTVLLPAVPAHAQRYVGQARRTQPIYTQSSCASGNCPRPSVPMQAVWTQPVARTVTAVATTVASSPSPASPSPARQLADASGRLWSSYPLGEANLVAFVAQRNAELAGQPRAAAVVQATPAYTTTEAAFLTWLNSYRARYNLRAVGWDTGLVAGCQANNAEQSRRGIGHHQMGFARRQNAAWSVKGVGDVQTMWAHSPGHNAALLDPTITGVAISAAGPWWTFGAR